MTLLCSCSAGVVGEPLVEYSTDVVVTGSRSQVLTRQLDAGIYVLEIRERDIDLRVALDCGERHSVLADASTRHGLLRTVVRLGADSRLRLTLDSLDVRGWKGAAAVRILRWPRTDPEAPDQRLLGFESLGAAHELIAAGTPAEWRAALAPLREAARHFQAGGDLHSMAEAEYLRGRVERDLLFGFNGETARLALLHFRAAADAVGAQRAAILLASNELAAAARMGAEVPRSERTALLERAARRLAQAGAFFESRDMQSDALEAVDLDLGRMRLVGRTEVAIATAYEAMRERARRRADAYFEVLATRGLANIALRSGDAARAAQLFERVIAFVERPRNPGLYARLRGDFGRALLALGEFDRALELHSEAFRLFASRGNDRRAAHELLALATIQLRTGNPELALDAVEGALPLFQRSQDQPGKAAALRIAGMAAAGMDRHERALEYLQDAERLERDRLNLGRTRLLIAGELRALGDLEEAAALVARLVPTVEDALLPDAFAERARLRLARGRLDAALADLRTADAGYERLKLDY
ncbi:MAG TPA: tetratricopeptide repeat protein, partial [Steroidobacteraceae bacterium]|nr:tetratricopeptide repeat protein [Steroidobacteraceae bacterium]